MNKTSLMTNFVFNSFLYLLLLVLVGCSPAKNPAANNIPQGNGILQITISGLRSANGQVILSLFPSADGFPEATGPTIQERLFPLTENRAQINFENLPYGVYAVSVLHDEDNDGLMNKTWVGRPREGFGFSGRPDYRFGPPKFSQASFILVRPVMKVEIVVQYDTGREKERAKAKKQTKP